MSAPVRADPFQVHDTAPSVLAGDVVDPACLAAACERAAAAAGSPVDPARAIEAAIEVLHVELGGAPVGVFVLEHGRLWPLATRGYAMMPEGRSTAEGVIGRAARSGSTQLVPDVASDPDYVEMVRGVASNLALPLVSDIGLIGVLSLETFSPLPDSAALAGGVLVAALVPLVDELRSRRTLDLSSLARLFVHVSSLRDPTAIGEVAVRSLTRVLPVEASQLVLRDESGRLVETAVWRASEESPRPLSAAELALLRERTDPLAVFELLDMSSVPLLELDHPHLRSVVLIPLRAGGEEFGLLVGTSRFAKEFDQRQAETAALLAAHAAASLDAALALARERRSALTDPLTGLINRRGLEERLERELELAQDVRSPLSLIVLDCDDFKEVNDRAGHAVGDALLREVGEILRSTALEVGCAARLGGDEFVVVLPDTDAAAAQAAAAELRQTLCAGLDEAGFPLRLSAGIATYPYDAAGATQLLRVADQALYEAKACGKDRAVPFHELVRGRAAIPIGRVPPAENRRREEPVLEAAMLAHAVEAAAAVSSAESHERVLDRLGKAVAFVLGAIGTQISRVHGDRLVDLMRHALRDVDLGPAAEYLIDEFPLTREVLESGVSRAISFLDDDLDPAEAFVLRELGMSCCLLLPLRLAGRSYGLVEVYDTRLRRFGREDVAVAEFLVDQAAKRLEALGGDDSAERPLPLYRLPD